MVLEQITDLLPQRKITTHRVVLFWLLIYLFLTHVVCCFDFSNNGKVQGEKDNKLHSLLFAITGNLEGLFSKLELLSAFGRSHYQTFILLPSRRDGLQCMITSTYETHTPEISDNRPAKMENQRAGTRFSATNKDYTHTQTQRQVPTHIYYFSFYLYFYAPVPFWWHLPEFKPQI